MIDRASRTAERVAERRAAHQILDQPPVLVDPIALRIIGEEAAARVREEDQSRLAPYLRAFLAARSRFAEDELALAVQRGVRQYVLIGAGFDTFAYRNPHPQLRVFEIDHPLTQDAKRERLKTAGIEVPDNVRYVPADLRTTSVRQALDSAGFNATQPAVFAWLGVVPYLELPAIRAVLSDIAALPAGSEIIFDYSIPPESMSMLGRFVVNRMAERVAKAGEPWKTYFKPEDLHELLTSIGFHEIEDLGGTQINARYFAQRKDGLRVGEAGRIARAVV